MDYLPTLEFTAPEIKIFVENRCGKALKKEQFEIRQKWLGTFFAPQISKGYCPDVSIRWINDELKYGVFAETAFPSGALIGEYTGIVRKRKWRLDRKNDYCFDYSIGERRSPFVIDASFKGNHTRFINHDEHANLEPFAVCLNSTIHILLIACRPIAQYEQLCYDYGKAYWSKRNPPTPLNENG